MSGTKSISLNRVTNSITISEFYELHNLKKYNYEPIYQRKGNVWSLEKQSFLIDSILKNYPIPPIFLHSEVDPEDGKTTYNVIDGKQRLMSIVKFIKNEIMLPENFGDDDYGSDDLNGLKFSEIDQKSPYKNNFWRYSIPIEYVDTTDSKVVERIFDRLNRNGEPLNGQELRNATYNSSPLLKQIKELSEIDFWSNTLEGIVEKERMEDDEFVSELLFTILEDDIFDSKPNVIDELYQKWSEKCTEDTGTLVKAVEEFHRTTEFISNLNLDLTGFKINGVSHLYGIWCFSLECLKVKVQPHSVITKLNEMFTLLRSKDFSNDQVSSYKNSMSHSTKSKNQRNKRKTSLIEFCEIDKRS